MRRAVPHFLALAGAGAAVLAAAFAHAQPAARQGLRPAIEDTDQYPRFAAPRRNAPRDTRPDGATQVTYDGHPLYRYAGDSKAGDTNGQGINEFGALWYVLSATGNEITTASASSGASNGY